MIIIMNPPYNRNLHLKILREVINECEKSGEDYEIVNISPVRWLQDPLAEYKKNSDWKKFEDVRKHIESVEVITKDEANKLFDIGLFSALGIYKISKENTDWTNDILFKNHELLKKMTEKSMLSSLNSHIIIDDLQGISCLVSLFRGGRNGRTEKSKQNATFASMKKEKCFFTDGVNDFTGKTYYEQRKETAWGNCKLKSENTNIKFSSKEERENFYNSWHTKPLRWLFANQLVAANVYPRFLPYLGDYTHPWTSEDLYDFFDLTDEERQFIEEAIK